MKQTRKKILIITTEFPPVPAGIGTHAYNLANELHLLGWKVKVYTEHFEPYQKEVEEFNRQCRFPVHRTKPAPGMFELLWKLVKLIFEIISFNPSLIVGTGKHGVWFASLMGKLTFRKSVAIGHGTEFTVVMSERSRKINRWAYSSTDAIVHVSDFTRQIAEKIGIKNRRSFILHNGADGKFFKVLDNEMVKNFRQQKGVAEAKILVTVGNVSDRKGQEFVIRALPKVLQVIPDVQYYCIGHHSVKDKLAAIAKELGVEERVHFPKKVPAEELRLWLNACDVYCLTSVILENGDFEGFGISVIEAALCGKPAVVSGEAGVAESIIEGITGLSVPPRNHETIADRLVMLLSDDELRIRLGKNALKNASDNLTWEKVIRKYEEIFLSL